MLLNRFFINVVVRILFLVVSCVGLGIVLQHLDKGYYYTLTGMIVLILFQTYLLIIFVNKTNTDLEIFFAAFHDHDSSVRFSKSTKSNSFDKLYERMNALNVVIQNAKVENERTGLFLQNIVDHIDAGLLSCDMNGDIRICNKAAAKYLNIRQPMQLSVLKTTNIELFKIISTIKPGDEILHKMDMENVVQSVMVRATQMKFEENVIKLISFQDITNELEKKELDSWQKIIRVLTHEIMNSISPVTSLTSVIAGYYKDSKTGNAILPEMINQQIISKTLSGLDTIEETGKGLLDFVDKYRSLTSLPEPHISSFTVESLFQRCRVLMESNMSDRIKIVTTVFPENIEVEADYSQIEQVLINLIKNANEALGNKKNGIIRLQASFAEGCTTITVEDNGAGIPENIVQDIFVPFYTTKKNGSGIGLSLSRQIIQNHSGTISVISTPGKGSKFTLKFQQPIWE